MQKKILEVIVGSTVHGVSIEDGLEDLDLMAIFLEDQKDFIGFNPKDVYTMRTKPKGVRSEAGDIDWVGYGLRKFLNLAIKGNPSILLAFFVPSKYIRNITSEGKALRELSSYIVSKTAYKPFKGYLRQQHERLLGLRGQRNVTRPELIEAYGYDTKYAYHIVRLGIQGEELLLTGKISLPMNQNDKELCIAIRTGKFSLVEISDQIIKAEKRIDKAFNISPLPNKPNIKVIEEWMMQVYLQYWTKEE